MYDRGYLIQTDPVTLHRYLVRAKSRHVVSLISRAGLLFVAVWIGNMSSSMPPSSTALLSTSLRLRFFLRFFCGVIWQILRVTWIYSIGVVVISMPTTFDDFRGMH